MAREKDWDMEYSTSFLDEMIWYKKEKRLWDALSSMYSNKKYEVRETNYENKLECQNKK